MSFWDHLFQFEGTQNLSGKPPVLAKYHNFVSAEYAMSDKTRQRKPKFMSKAFQFFHFRF